MKPLPTLSQCYAILLQEETQCASKPFLTTDRLAMSVKSTSIAKFQNSKSTPNIKCNLSENNKKAMYDYCHQSGHTRDKCFCLNGYPQWHKLFGKPKPKPKFLQTTSYTANAATVNASSTVADKASSSDVASSTLFDTPNISSRGLSTSQYTQLLNMLQTNLRETNSVDKSGVTWPYTSSANSTHIAGPWREEGTRDW